MREEWGCVVEDDAVIGEARRNRATGPLARRDLPAESDPDLAVAHRGGLRRGRHRQEQDTEDEKEEPEGHGLSDRGRKEKVQSPNGGRWLLLGRYAL